MRNSVRAFMIVAVVLASARTASAQTGKACNSVAPGTDAGIVLNIAKGINLGTVARPSTGKSGIIKLSADGTRTLPNTLTVPRDSATGSTRAPYASSVEVTGGAGCRFRIAVASLSNANLYYVRLQPASGYALSSSSSGAEGVLDAAGWFRFTLGVWATVNDMSTTSSVTGAINLSVEYY